MTTAVFESHFRLRELHSLFYEEFDRRAHDNACRLLKQIRKESRGAQNIPDDVPTATTEGRLTFWRAMYTTARANRNIGRAAELLEHMRQEDTQRA